MNRKLDTLAKTLPSKYCRSYMKKNNPYQTTNSYNECFQVASEIKNAAMEELRNLLEDIIESGLGIEEAKNKYL